MDLELFAKMIEKLRGEILFSDEADALGPMSENFFLLALASLDAAHRQMMIACYHRRRKD